MKIKTSLIRFWRRLRGSIAQFPLTTRVFHSVCIIILIALAYSIPLNYAVGLHDIALLSAVAFASFAVIYYLSRFKRKTHLALLIFCVVGNLLFIINYFLNSGIDGPTDLYFIATMVVMITVIPVRHYWVLITINIIVVLGLHYLQFTYPKQIPYTYDTRTNHYFDISSSYIVVLGITLLNFYFLRRNYEAEKRSAEQKTAVLKLLNEEKSKLFSILSHDLRAPLSNIQNYLEILVDADMSQEEQQEINSKLLQSTRSTLDMLNNVLLWSKSQMDGLKFKLTPIHLHELLLPQLLLFTNIAGSKKIKIEVAVDHDIQIIGNSDMMQIIIRNLVNNAIKFTSPGGQITIIAQQQNECCVLSVSDSGSGKPVKLRPDIFYLNSDSTTGTANEKGVGLGLVLCKEFTEAQNGRIWFECDHVSGTTFFTEFPLLTEHQGIVAI